MGKLHSKEDKESRFVAYGCKVYTQEELEALNIFIKMRQTLPKTYTNIISANEDGKEVFMHTRLMKPPYWIGKDNQDQEWMLVRSGKYFRRMFRLEPWWKFNFGQKEAQKWTHDGSMKW